MQMRLLRGPHSNQNRDASLGSLRAAQSSHASRMMGFERMTEKNGARAVRTLNPIGCFHQRAPCLAVAQESIQRSRLA